VKIFQRINRIMNSKFMVVVSTLLIVLIIAACMTNRSEKFVSQANLKNIPVFYINLDSDTNNRMLTEKTLRGIFPRVERSPGIRHSIGKEGCRRAHISANTKGIATTKPGEYYIIFEDDVKINPNAMMQQREVGQAILNCARTNADMILLNVQNRPESAMLEQAPINIQRLSVSSKYPEFYRILGGTGGGAAYMVKHEFGKKMIKNWEKHPMEHIDWTWHELWPTNIVLLHRPLLFLQRPGPSKTGDTDFRLATDPELEDFDWKIAEYYL
jgi:GR25 family glycosyltransferase involved in LPS biosynthesis